MAARFVMSAGMQERESLNVETRNTHLHYRRRLFM